jgi:hypothetical protein
MMLNKFRIALAATLLALAAVTAVDSASASFYDGGAYWMFRDGGFAFGL